MLAMRDQHGSTMVELLVSISATLIVFTAVITLTTAVLHHQDRINRRVDATSRARPVMTRIVQELHSACVTSHIVPVRAPSSGTSISFLSKSGSGVGLTPDLHKISLSGTTLTETVTPATPGSIPPSWDFSGSASSPRTLLTNVAAPGGVMFRYYDFVTGTGALNTTPLATPLVDTTTAPRAAYVTVSFTSSPRAGVSTLDPKSPLLLTSGVDLRLENAGQYPNQDNLPCI
jgi:Tfp pilus assembly protein PilW